MEATPEQQVRSSTGWSHCKAGERGRPADEGLSFEMSRIAKRWWDVASSELGSSVVGAGGPCPRQTVADALVRCGSHRLS